MRSVMIEYDVYAKALAAGINISQSAENGLRHELIRIGGNIKTIQELQVEKEMEERQRKVKDAENEAARALALAQGKMYVDENSPNVIDISKHMRKRGR